MVKREGARLNESFCPILQCLRTHMHIFTLRGGGGFKKNKQSILVKVNMMKNFVIYQSFYAQANTNQ